MKILVDDEIYDLKKLKWTNSVITSPLPNGKHWLLRKDISYITRDNKRIDIPEGFIFDWASVPRFLWAIFSPPDTHGIAALIHDWLFWIQTHSRTESDLIFYQAMRDIFETTETRAKLMLYFVQKFSRFAWANNKKMRGMGVTKMFPLSDETITIRKLDIEKAIRQ